MLHSDRLSLEPLAVSHVDEMVEVLSHLELYEFTGGEPPDARTLTRRYESQVRGSGDADEQWLNWILRENSSSRAIGFVQATVTGEGAAIAWTVGTAHQGRGFATEAARVMKDYLVSCGVDRFEAYIHPQHVASERVASALGLVHSGAFDDDGEVIWVGP